MTLFEIGLLGFIIGFTGAMAPGPTLITTIQSSIRDGWMSGPRVTGGHIIAEFIVVLILAAGIPFLSPGSSVPIAWIGGLALIIFGIMTFASAKDATLLHNHESSHSHSAIIAGLLTSVSNPYFWIWWFSVGSALLLSSLAEGISGLIAFIVGHWLSDLSWFTLVSVSVYKSRVLIRDREYQIILGGCGILLIIFGCWFIISTNG